MITEIKDLGGFSLVQGILIGVLLGLILGYFLL
jgi:F0F1-type ATP synthase assembly protein I